MNTGLYTDPIFLQHDTGDHPENAGRLDAISSTLRGNGMLGRLQVKQSQVASAEDIERIHTRDHVRRVEEAALSGMRYLGTPDCVLSHETYLVAQHAAGAVVQAASEVAQGRLDNAFVACRPPGHHAEANRALGFCYFNNVAIAAAFLTDALGYQRVLIFDFDVHHGNGTQHAFDARRDVFYCSVHQHPRTCYPGTGYAEERGAGDGLGFTLNAPVLPYATDADYLALFDGTLLPAFMEYKPDFILLSAGFDAHRDDPLALVNLTQVGFDHMARGMKRLSLDCCQGRLVSVLEGGYNYARLSECVTSHLEILQADPA
ncbi:MAG: histone deacetylase [Candidatus Lambdaproteobacteria bacterium]|nr:histone deacetylase [Candidatus Lambdaproteobacteria bacterium]